MTVTEAQFKEAIENRFLQVEITYTIDGETKTEMVHLISVDDRYIDFQVYENDKCYDESLKLDVIEKLFY